jgi:hypothetical protein
MISPYPKKLPQPRFGAVTLGQLGDCQERAIGLGKSCSHRSQVN